MQQIYNLHSQRKRIFALILLISFIFMLLFIKLFFVQVVNSNELQKKALSQWTRDLPLTAERGNVTDVYGSTLAVSYSTYDIYTRARQIENPTSVAKYLSEILQLDFDKTLSKVTNKGVSEVLIKMQVEKEVANKIISKEFKGVYFSENIKRYYPYGDLLTQVLGFTSIDNEGQAGIEAYFNKYLKGTNGASLIQSNLIGNKIDNTLEYYLPAISGMNVQLTIDTKIQLIVEQTLNTLMIEQKAKSANCIVMNPKTGEILAMSTKPSFDLNNVPRDDVSTLMSTVKNKSVVDVYEPGSTFKIVSMAMAIETGSAQLSDGFYCPGYRIVDGEKIKCWKHIGHGSQDLTDGLCNSCNCVFIDLAQRIGLDKFYSMCNKIGLGQKTGISILGESSGILMEKEKVKTVDLSRMGFGQAIAMTPLQLITSVASTINGGNLITPYIVKSVTTKENKVVLENKPVIREKVFSDDTSNKIRTMLEEVVSTTAKYSFVPGYRIGGKTGTTQKYENGGVSGDKYISSFVGTYPANNPDYIILITVDEPGTGAYYGSIVASPYAKKIFEGIFNTYNIEPIDIETGEEKIKKTIVMPNVEGKSLADACSILKQLNLTVQISGEGSIVKKQLPPEGTMMFEYENVILDT